LPLSTPACPPRITPGPNVHVVADAHLPGDHRAIAHRRRAGNPGQRHQNHVSPMSQLWPTWTRLSILVPRRSASASAPRGRWSSWRRSPRRPRSPASPAAETACRRRSSRRARSQSHPPQHRAGMNHDAVAQRGSRIEHGARIDAAFSPMRRPRRSHRASLDPRSRAERGAIANHRAGADRHAFAQVRHPPTTAVGCTPPAGLAGLQQLGGARKPQPRLIGLHNRHRQLAHSLQEAPALQHHTPARSPGKASQPRPRPRQTPDPSPCQLDGVHAS
jgi:hypothetical protein